MAFPKLSDRDAETQETQKWVLPLTEMGMALTMLEASRRGPGGVIELFEPSSEFYGRAAPCQAVSGPLSVV